MEEILKSGFNLISALLFTLAVVIYLKLSNLDETLNEIKNILDRKE